MKHGRTLVGLFGIGLAMATACATAQTTANGPYYATPSWDQTMPASTRFVVLSNFNNEAVLDRETGLVWQQNPSPTTLNWVFAQNFASGCPGATTGGRGGWRLPRLDELQTLTTGLFTPLPAGHPFGANTTGTFWTANVFVGSSSNAITWNVGGGDGASAGDVEKTSQYAVWCVRSPSSGFAGY